jgi:glycerol-3-phosphate dehydrogenase (NAD(P)+)
MSIERIGIIGGGAWGTALAETLALSGRDVLLWAHEAETVADINERHVNRQFLPGISLCERLRATSNLSDMNKRDAILMVTPAQHVRRISQALSSHLLPGVPLVMCAKGIEQGTGKLMGEVIAETIEHVTFAVLSGPSFAIDVARGLPAALTLACRREDTGLALSRVLGGRHLRIYWSNDILGVELGGALKNVLAIAAGIVDGKGLGASAHAALVTRGFAELRRFSEAMGARSETLMGLSGLGDLILTCGSPQSRNMSLGRALGQGKALDEVLGTRASVTEGVYTAAAVVQIARSLKIEMPVCEAVFDIIEGHATIDAAIARLMQRPLKAED